MGSAGGTDAVRQALWWLAGAALVFAAVCFPLTNTDIWWHLASGRLMVEQPGWLRTDPFATGEAWVNLHWLFQLGALGAYRLGGPAALVLAKSTLVALGALLLLLAVRRSVSEGWITPIAVVLLAAVVHLARNLVLARPVVVTLVCLALFLLVLERFRRGARPRLLLWLLPVQLAWANAQGGLQLLGPAVVLSYLAGDGLARLVPGGLFDRASGQVRWLALLLPALLLCGLVTPHGLEGLTLPFTLLGRIDPVGAQLFSRNVSENVPPWLLERGAAAALEVTSFKWVAALAFASFLPLVLLRRPIALSRLLLLVGLFALALGANRNILLFAWVAAPVAAINLGLLRRQAPAPGVRRALAVLALAGLAAIGVHRYLAARDEPSIARLAPFRVPDLAVDRLESLSRALGPHSRGALFNSVRYGGYLIWRLHPRAHPVIDGRLVLRSAAQLAEHLDLADTPALFEGFRRAQGIEIALLPSALPDRYLPLVAWLYRDPAWHLLFTDGTQTLFVREAGSLPWSAGRARKSDTVRGGLPAGVHPLDLSDPGQVRRIAHDLRRRWSCTPAIAQRGVLHLGRLLAAVGQPRRAVELLDGQGDLESRTLLARALYLDGQTRRAEALAKELIEAHGDDVNNLVLLVLVATDRGQGRRAVGLLERALALDPHSRQARQALARIGQDK